VVGGAADPVATIWWELVAKSLVASGAARGLLSAEGLDPAHAVASWIEANRGALEGSPTYEPGGDRRAGRGHDDPYGLKVKAGLDQSYYVRGIKITDYS